MRLSDLERYHQITIQCHDNPDADTLASGYGLFCYFREKGKNVRLVYSGRNKIQKSNLRLMVEKLKLPVEYIDASDERTVQLEGLLITVDCQYGSGNVTGLKAKDVAVIDHHQMDGDAASMCIINPNLGSCATLVWKLLQEEGFDIDSDAYLGTALYYGLYTDTNQFSELYNPLDMDMREAVNADKGLITLFRNSNISLKELEIAGIALIRYSYNNDYEFAVIKAQPCDPNILGLISDFLLQVDAIKTCVVFNEVNDGYKFSVRSCIWEENASELAEFLADGIGSGGGHYEKAGGFISMKLYEDKYPTLHSEGYFNNRMTEYFDSYDLIYTDRYEADIQPMEQYVKRRLPLGYVRLEELLPIGTPITIRTMEGDIDMKIEKDFYIIIGSQGEVDSVSGTQFWERYQPLEGSCQVEEYLHRPDYIPVIKNRRDGKDMLLMDHARGCVSVRNEKIYAIPLEKGVKIFSPQLKNKYMSGRPGDYLAVSCEDIHDIYVVKKEVFDESFESCKAKEDKI